VLPLAFVLVLVTATPVTRGVVVAHEESGEWQPIDPRELGRAVEQVALEVLSAPGLLRLERAGADGRVPDEAEFVVRIFGRTIAESETHTVHLSFEPAARTELAGFRAADSVVLGKLPRATMLQRVEQSARTAATALLAVLRPALERGADPGVASRSVALPWRWSEVKIPEAKNDDARELYGKDAGRRAAALRVLASGALGGKVPRNALESCVLSHADDEMRLGCLRALRPLSRTFVPTQRVVIEALRKDTSSAVRAEASEQMLYFTGLSRVDAILAWLERAAAGEVLGPLDQLGDQPNLDLVIARCLVAAGSRPKYQRSKSACLGLVAPLPPARRWALLEKPLREIDPDSPLYLEGAGEREGSIGTDWQRAVEAVLDNARRFPPELEDILWRRYERTMSSSAVDVLGEYAEPSERLATRLLEVVQTAGDRNALSGLSRLGKTAPALRPLIKEKLAELIATGSFAKDLNARDLEEVVRRLEKN
jgi:hypothetical protein